MVGVEMVLPLYLQDLMGHSPFESGLTMLPGALLIGLMSPVTGRLFDQYGIRNLAITGFAILTLGNLPGLDDDDHQRHERHPSQRV